MGVPDGTVEEEFARGGFFGKYFLFAAGVQELDGIKRKAYYDEYQEIIADEAPMVYTALGARLTAVRNKFGNLKPGIYGGVFHNLEEIYVDIRR